MSTEVRMVPTPLSKGQRFLLHEALHDLLPPRPSVHALCIQNI